MPNEKLPGSAYDNKIYAKFSQNTLEKKKENKKAFLEEFHFNCGNRDFLLGIVTSVTSKNGGDILEKLLEGFLFLPLKVVVRGIGTEKFQKIIGDFAQQYPEKILIMPDGEEELRKILSAVNATLFLADGMENETLSRAALSYAALPIAPQEMHHIIENYNPNQESGTGFLFEAHNEWSVFAALVRAVENFRFPYDWKSIQKSALEV